MQEPGGIGLLCACLISAYRAASPTITKENKKGVGGRAEGLLVPGKHGLFFGRKHRVMIPDQKKWKKMAKAICVTIVYDMVKEEGYNIRNLNHMRNTLQLCHSLLPLQSQSSIITSYCPVFTETS